MSFPSGNVPFPPTHWSLISKISSSNQEQALHALNHFCKKYHPPLLAYARAAIIHPQNAEDCVQEFFLKILDPGFFARINPQRGKLRTFLLTCLKRHIIEIHRHHSAQKRGGAIPHLPLDEAHPLPAAPSPEELYNRQWALTLLETSLSKLEQTWTTRGKAPLFHALKPLLDPGGEKNTSQAQLASSLGITTGALKVTLHRLRKEYRELLLAEVSSTLENPIAPNIEQELRELLRCI